MFTFGGFLNLAQHQFSLETELAKIELQIMIHVNQKFRLHQLISDLSRNYIMMENRTHSLSYGKKIKDIFEVFRGEMKNTTHMIQNYKDHIY